MRHLFFTNGYGGAPDAALGPRSRCLLAVLGLPSAAPGSARRAVASTRCRAGGRCASRRPRPRRRSRRRPRRPSPTARARRWRGRRPAGPRRRRRLAAGPRAERVRLARAAAALSRQVRRYRTSFVGPPTPRGFSWLIRFDSVRRNAAVILNGRRIGRNVDPYTPFTVPARGLRPGRRNVLEVIVDGRKNPQLPEALVELERDRAPGSPRARRAGAHRGPRHDVARALPRARPATAGPSCSWTGCSSGAAPRAIRPSLDVRLRAPGGRVTERTLPAAGAAREAAPACSCRCRCRRRCSGRPTRRSSTRAVFTLRNGDRVVQRERPPDRAALGGGEARATCGSTTAASSCAARRSTRTCRARARRSPAPTWTGSSRT